MWIKGGKKPTPYHHTVVLPLRPSLRVAPSTCGSISLGNWVRFYELVGKDRFGQVTKEMSPWPVTCKSSYQFQVCFVPQTKISTQSPAKLKDHHLLKPSHLVPCAGYYQPKPTIYTVFKASLIGLYSTIWLSQSPAHKQMWIKGGQKYPPITTL